MSSALHNYASRLEITLPVILYHLYQQTPGKGDYAIFKSIIQSSLMSVRPSVRPSVCPSV